MTLFDLIKEERFKFDEKERKDYKEMKKKYTLILYEDEFGDYVCEVNEIKGMIGVGNTPSEALRELSEFMKARELIELYLSWNHLDKKEQKDE